MFKINTTNMKSAAPWRAAGLTVTVFKQSCAPRCIAETDNTPRARQLLEDYEADRVLDIPALSVMRAYTSLLAECKALQVGRIGGTV